MLFGKVERSNRVRYHLWRSLNNDPAFRGGHLFPNNRLTGSKVHFPPEFRRNGNLAPFRNPHFHMTLLSCEVSARKRFSLEGELIL